MKLFVLFQPDDPYCGDGLFFGVYSTREKAEIAASIVFPDKEEREVYTLIWEIEVDTPERFDNKQLKAWKELNEKNKEKI